MSEPKDVVRYSRGQAVFRDGVNGPEAEVLDGFGVAGDADGDFGSGLAGVVEALGEGGLVAGD